MGVQKVDGLGPTFDRWEASKPTILNAVIYSEVGFDQFITRDMIKIPRMKGRE